MTTFRTDTGIVIKRYVEQTGLVDSDVTTAAQASKINYDIQVMDGEGLTVFSAVAPQPNVRWPDVVPGTTDEFWTFPFAVGTIVDIRTALGPGTETSYIIAPRELPYFARCEDLGGAP